jgi:hypothetical protein
MGTVVCTSKPATKRKACLSEGQDAVYGAIMKWQQFFSEE